MKTVRIFAFRQFDEITGKWSRGRYRYELDEIASFPRAEPILDDWEDVVLPDAEDVDRNSTGALIRRR